MGLFDRPTALADPLVEQLRSEVAYLREQLKAARAETKDARDAYEFLVNARAKVELEVMRRDLAAPRPPPPQAAPRGERGDPRMDAALAAGGHLEDDLRSEPQTEDEMADATIEAEAERKERELLEAALASGVTITR